VGHAAVSVVAEVQIVELSKMWPEWREIYV